MNRLSIRNWLLHSRKLGTIALFTSLLGGLFAVFSLASAAGNSEIWAQHYVLILWINISIIIGLSLLVLLLLGRLLFRLRKARFGARLTLKFASAFAFLGALPGILVYVVSVFFLSQSIDSWFNVKVDAALNAGLELSRAAMQAQLQTLTQKARTAAATMDVGVDTLGAQAQRIRAQYGEVDVVFFTADAKVLANTVSLSTQGLMTDIPVGENLKLLKRNAWLAQIESVPSADSTSEAERLNLRAAVQVPKSSASDTPVLYLQLSQAVSPQLAQWAQTVALGSKNYDALSLGRLGLRKIYGVTLTITLLLSVLAAVTAGFVLADAMSAPLLRLAKGTKAVAAGDFSLLKVPTGQDDLAVLTRSFNRMLQELSYARSGLTQSKTYLEQVLSRLSTGVLVIDSKQNLRSINPSAQAILSIKSPDLNVFAGAQFPPEVWQAVRDKSDVPENGAWQVQLEVTKSNGEIQTLLMRGATLTQADGDGVLLVFDDVSEVMLAQKAHAWAEVARRLAHEIKNPLTPIQLSAERLMIKLGDKLTGTDAELLKRGTATIVTQVSALKTMVDEFRQYARLPQAKLAPLHLNVLIKELMGLYKSNPIQTQYLAQDDFILADADQVRQVLHNLLGNALDAAGERVSNECASKLESTGANDVLHGAVDSEVSSEVSSAHAEYLPQVTLVTQDAPQGLVLNISDNGLGFNSESLAKLFEPYYTSKSQGTGLGLAIVHRIVQDHHAKIKIKNRLGKLPNQVLGATVEISFPLHHTKR